MQGRSYPALYPDRLYPISLAAESSQRYSDSPSLKDSLQFGEVAGARAVKFRFPGDIVT
jgi:hypothetical protein